MSLMLVMTGIETIDVVDVYMHTQCNTLKVKQQPCAFQCSNDERFSGKTNYFVLFKISSFSFFYYAEAA